MNNPFDNLLVVQQHRWLWHLIYWFVSAFLLFFVFSNNGFELSIRITVVLVLVLMSIGLTQLINRFLIPRYLFGGRFFLFLYLIFGAVLISIWINMFCILLILWVTASKQMALVLPTVTDLVLLVSGSYIVILFAAFVHFIKETFARQMERDRIARQKAETDLKLQEARLKLLQGQLHPHFLFNMLNNLYGLWMEKSGETPEVIVKLSSLLDYMLYRCNQETVLLRDEIDFIRNYIDLELIRHDSRLKLELNLPTPDRQFEIAPLILFVLVENAFKHGAHKNSGQSQITINLKHSERSIDFEVSNNYLKSDYTTSGIGLQNMKERLNLLYPNRYKLDIASKDGLFTTSLHVEIDSTK